MNPDIGDLDDQPLNEQAGQMESEIFKKSKAAPTYTHNSAIKVRHSFLNSILLEKVLNLDQRTKRRTESGGFGFESEANFFDSGGKEN